MKKDICDIYNLIENEISPIKKSEIKNLKDALNRALFKDIKAVKNLPCFDNSAMDGYAFKFDDKDSPLKVIGTIFAGDTNEYELKDNEAYKIMTGAIMPKGSDTVIELEKAKFENDKLLIDKSIKKSNAYRYRGEEINIGKTILHKGGCLKPSDIMLLASQGISELEVFKELKIGIFSSGDEIVEPWERADEYQIYNANSSGILSLLQNHSFKADYLGILSDDFDLIVKKIESNLNYDILITSGGASVGEADYIKDGLEYLGFKPLFLGVNVRPGRPSKIYKKDDKYVIILPGNPMAAYLMSFIIALPFIRKLSGYNKIFGSKFLAKFDEDLNFKSIRSNLVLGIYENGKFKSINRNKFGSGMITPITLANALYISSVGEDGVKQNQEVEIIKFD